MPSRARPEINQKLLSAHTTLPRLFGHTLYTRSPSTRAATTGCFHPHKSNSPLCNWCRVPCVRTMQSHIQICAGRPHDGQHLSPFISPLSPLARTRVTAHQVRSGGGCGGGTEFNCTIRTTYAPRTARSGTR